MRVTCTCYVRLLIYEIRYVDDFLQESKYDPVSHANPFTTRRLCTMLLPS